MNAPSYTGSGGSEYKMYLAEYRIQKAENKNENKLKNEEKDRSKNKDNRIQTTDDGIQHTKL